MCVWGSYLQVEERVKVGYDDVPVFHLAAHVFNGMDGGLVVGLRAASRRETLQPHATCLTQLIEDQTSQFHCLDLCSGTHTYIRHVPVLQNLKRQFRFVKDHCTVTKVQKRLRVCARVQSHLNVRIEDRSKRGHLRRETRRVKTSPFSCSIASAFLFYILTILWFIQMQHPFCPVGAIYT